MHYRKLENMICEEIEQIGERDELSDSSLGNLHILTDVLKNLKKIQMLDEASDYSEYSERTGGSYRGGSYRGGSYRGSSYARRRDSMGRFSRAGGGSYRGYSRDEAKGDIAEQIEELMRGAQTEQERSVLQTAMQALEQA